MWVVSVGLLLYLVFSFSLINIIIGCLILISPANLMSCNIEYLYIMSAILFLAYKASDNKIFLPLKLILDFIIYILAGTAIEYDWVFTFPIALDLLQLILPYQRRIYFL